MKKRIITMLLATMVFVSTLSGCGQIGNKAESTTSNKVYDVAPEATVETAEYGAVATYEETGACYEECESYDNGIMADEAYSATKENKAENVFNNSLSTFAADVDTASYSNLRRMINQGLGLYDIPANSIRTEEIVNYFKYDYKEPENGEVFAVDAQISDCPWNKENKLLALGINTAKCDSEDIPDCNIVFLVDVSGSMSSSNKLPLIQKAMALLVDKFDAKDRISIVTYASGVNTVLDGCKGSDQKKIIKAFEGLVAAGSTNGGDGIKLAYKVAKKNYIKGGVNRVIICSDGDFNVGLTSQSELENLISNKKDDGIFLSTLGFGMGNYSDTTMETLADKGNGNYAYIDDLVEAKKVLVDEMTSTFVTVAKDVKFQVEFNPALVSEYRLVGYENRMLDAKDFTDDTKDGGELGAGHQVTALYEITLAYDNSNNNLKYQDNKVSKKGADKDEYCTLSIAYKDIDSDESNYLEYPIGIDNYTNKPSCNYKLQAALAQASLGIKDSEYLVDMTKEEAINSSINIVKKIEDKFDDEYVKEFRSLLEQMMDQSICMYEDDLWYE